MPYPMQHSHSACIKPPTISRELNDRPVFGGDAGDAGRVRTKNSRSCCHKYAQSIRLLATTVYDKAHTCTSCGCHLLPRSIEGHRSFSLPNTFQAPQKDATTLLRIHPAWAVRRGFARTGGYSAAPPVPKRYLDCTLPWPWPLLCPKQTMPSPANTHTQERKK